jgi:Mn2+/Fe2+ NRAMP family transporter
MDHIITLLTGPGAALIFALVVLYAGYKRWWVFGWIYQETLAEKKEWKEAALRSVTVAERAISPPKDKTDVP